MASISTWDLNEINANDCRWVVNNYNGSAKYLAFKLTALPNFSDPRFEYLGKEKDSRPTEVAKKQIQALRQLNSYGETWTYSLRITKDKNLTLYLIFRLVEDIGSTEKLELTGGEAHAIRNSLPSEYTFEELKFEDLSEVTDLSWANESASLFKEEQYPESAEFPEGIPRIKFYVPFQWTPTENTMKIICESLMNHKGKACIDVTLSPTRCTSEEIGWMNQNAKQLREHMNGFSIRDEDGRKVLDLEKRPVLKTPLDNLEKEMKQYETSPVFLSSINVFAESDAEFLAKALMANSVRNRGQVKTCKKDSAEFSYLTKCFEDVDNPLSICSDNWDNYNVSENEIQWRAQRFHKLVSVEEAANFFRFPIPKTSGFPGFLLDTGLGTSQTEKANRSTINVGTYLDETGMSGTPAKFDSQQFAKHGLMVGVPGSGKTTAMFNILYQFWAVPEEERIPFIVLEPAKTEYRALKTLPEFEKDMLVFTLGDEDTSPFRFNPMEVLPGIKLENHISKLQACFVGAFDLFDPLPIFLEQAIRRTYLEKGWYDDSKGGEPGLETPTLADLSRNADYIVEHSGFDPKMKSDFKASLLERLNSLRRGAKGRMLDCKHSIPMEDLMNKPVVLELDNLNGDEKSLMMMFLLSYVYEYCKAERESGSDLSHMLIVEEAHNLISSQGGDTSRANPKAQTIELFVNMLAEMRALGQGILIADQLPTAIAPQAVKQTNVKMLMRVTAKDDREEIGNTMDLNEEQMHQVVNFKTGHAYLYHEGEDRVRMIRMPNFKDNHKTQVPPNDKKLRERMDDYELNHPELYLPFPECSRVCEKCNRRLRNQVESFVETTITGKHSDVYRTVSLERFKETQTFCGVCLLAAMQESKRIIQRYGDLDDAFGHCVYVHLLNKAENQMNECQKTHKKCSCSIEKLKEYNEKFIKKAIAK